MADEIVSVTCRFTYDPLGKIFNANKCAGTATLELLTRWKSRYSTRDYEVIEDDNDFLVATLTTTRSDVDATRDDIASRCDALHLIRTVC